MPRENMITHPPADSSDPVSRYFHYRNNMMNQTMATEDFNPPLTFLQYCDIMSSSPPGSDSLYHDILFVLRSPRLASTVYWDHKRWFDAMQGLSVRLVISRISREDSTASLDSLAERQQALQRSIQDIHVLIHDGGPLPYGTASRPLSEQERQYSLQDIQTVGAELEAIDARIATIPTARSHLPSKEEVLASMATAGPSKDTDGDEIECPICSDELKAADVRKTSCGHGFCQGCIEHWFETANTCPMCRTEMFDPATRDSDEGNDDDEYDEVYDEDEDEDDWTIGSILRRRPEMLGDDWAVDGDPDTRFD